MFQDLCGKDLRKDPKAPSANTLKKRTLEFVFKTQGELKFIKKHNRESSLPRGRGRLEEKNKFEGLETNELSQVKPEQKIISLGNKFNKKKRSKTEHGARKIKNQANQEIFVKIKKEAAAKSIQRAWRKFFIEKKKRIDKKVKEQEIEESFAVLTQVWKKVCFGLLLVADRAVKKFVDNVLKIQAGARRMVEVKKFRDLKGKIRKVQGFWMCCRERRKFLKVLNGVKRVQALFRGIRERKMIKRWDLAARVIQKYVKWFLLKVFIGKNEGFRKVIRKFLIFSLKAVAVEMKPLSVIEEESKSVRDCKFLVPVVKIQSLFRMFPLMAYYKILKKSTCFIQKCVRGYLQRKHLRIQQKSAKMIQKFVKEKFHFRFDYEISCY